MTVQREELVATGRRVTENDDGAVVLRYRIVRECVDDAVERRVHRCPRGGEKVQPDMNRASLALRPLTAKEWRGVEQARLVVSAHCDTNCRLAHHRGGTRRQLRFGVLRRIAVHERARDSKVEHDRRFSPQIDAEHRRERSTLGAEPFSHPRAMRNGLSARRVAHDRDRQRVRHSDESRQRSINPPLADAQIIIVWSRLLLLDRDRGTERQP